MYGYVQDPSTKTAFTSLGFSSPNRLATERLFSASRPLPSARAPAVGLVVFLFPPAERRALIEDAAARLFAERGYSATDQSQTSSPAAGVSKPMLYRHFESKQDLQTQPPCTPPKTELAAAALDAFLNEPGDPDQRLPAMIYVVCPMSAASPHIEEPVSGCDWGPRDRGAPA